MNVTIEVFDKAMDDLKVILDAQEALYCTRVWEAWSYGTMGEDDFSRVSEDDEAVSEILYTVLRSLGLHTDAGIPGFEGTLDALDNLSIRK